jgi:dihydrofolate reductase
VRRTFLLYILLSTLFCTFSCTFCCPLSCAHSLVHALFCTLLCTLSSTHSLLLSPPHSPCTRWNADSIYAAITRALTLLYTLSLLTLLTRIQLNLLGRRTYLSSVVSLASPPTATDSSHISLENNDDDNYDNVYGNDFETNRKYLTFSWWLLHKGSKEIVEKVTAAVKDVFGPINPREDMTLERLSQLILQVRKKVEGATEIERREHRWLSYMLPPRHQEDFVLRESGIDAMSASPAPQESCQDPMSAASTASSNASLRRLLDETSDLIDSPTFTHVLTQILNASFSNLIDHRVATEAFKISPPAPDSLSRITDMTDKKCKFAQTLAVFCRQAHIIAAGSSEPDDLVVAESAGSQVNEYLAAIDQVKDLEAFAAVIYSSNFEFEAAEAQQTDSATIVPPPETTPALSPDASISAQPESSLVSIEAMDHVWNQSRTEAPVADPPISSRIVQAPPPHQSSLQQQDQEQEPSPQQPETQTQQQPEPKSYAMAAAAASAIPPLTLVVATTAKNGIGKNGVLPWPMLKKEMAYFARVTKRVPGASTRPSASMLAETASQLSDTSDAAATVNLQDPQNVVVMGRKTWESIPNKFRPLPQRTNVVISKSATVEGAGDDVVVSNSISSALSTLTTRVNQGKSAPVGRVFVIGGAAIYKQALEMEQAKTILLTRVEGEWDCDTDFPVDVEVEPQWTRKSKDELDAFVNESVEEKLEEEVKGQTVEYEFRLYERV